MACGDVSCNSLKIGCLERSAKNVKGGGAAAGCCPRYCAHLLVPTFLCPPSSISILTKTNSNSLNNELKKMMLPVVITKDDKFYVAPAPDVDIASQGNTIEEASANLKEAVDPYLEDEDAIRPEIKDRPIITVIEA